MDIESTMKLLPSPSAPGPESAHASPNHGTSASRPIEPGPGEISAAESTELTAAIAAGDVRTALQMGGTTAAAKARDVKAAQVVPGRNNGKLKALTADDTWDRFIDHVLDGGFVHEFELTRGNPGQISPGLLNFLPEPYKTQYKHIRQATADIYGERRHLALARAEAAAENGELSKTQLELLKLKLGLYRQEMEDRDPEQYRKQALVEVNVSPIQQAHTFVNSFRDDDSVTAADYEIIDGGADATP